jgi:hypothetical protein
VALRQLSLREQTQKVLDTAHFVTHLRLLGELGDGFLMGFWC